MFSFLQLSHGFSVWNSGNHHVILWLKFSKAQISTIRINNLHSFSDSHHQTMLSSCAKKVWMLTAFFLMLFGFWYPVLPLPINPLGRASLFSKRVHYMKKLHKDTYMVTFVTKNIEVWRSTILTLMQTESEGTGKLQMLLLPWIKRYLCFTILFWWLFVKALKSTPVVSPILLEL